MEIPLHAPENLVQYFLPSDDDNSPVSCNTAQTLSLLLSQLLHIVQAGIFHIMKHLNKHILGRFHLLMAVTEDYSLLGYSAV
jgi:hypothetical protein